jgi:hypothetical protein
LQLSFRVPQVIPEPKPCYWRAHTGAHATPCPLTCQGQGLLEVDAQLLLAALDRIAHVLREAGAAARDQDAIAAQALTRCAELCYAGSPVYLSAMAEGLACEPPQ